MCSKHPRRHAWLLITLLCGSGLLAEQASSGPALTSAPAPNAGPHPTSERTPSSPLEEQFQAASSAFDSGDFAAAATRLEQLQRQLPKSFQVHELLGMTYGAQSRNEEAARELQIAVDLEPQAAFARGNLATAFARAGKPQQAEAEWKQALTLAPRDYSLNRNLAQLYLTANRVTEALPLLEQAHQLRPAALDNGYDLALAELLTGHDEPSRALIGDLQSRHDSGELHNLLGRLDEKEGKFLQAGNEFATAAHMDPSEDNLFVWASELLLHRAYPAAIAVFRDATQRYSASPRLWIGLGMALYSRGEYQASIQSLLKAADLNPRDPRSYLFLSRAFLSSPDQAEAVLRCFQRYAELEPQNALAQYDYAIALWKARRVDDPEIDYPAVQALLQKSIALNDANPETHLQLGILYTEQHAYDKSLPEFERALQLDPNLADAHFRLGRYYLRAGDKSKSEAEFNHFKQLQAQHQAALDKERAEVQQFVTSDPSQVSSAH